MQSSLAAEEEQKTLVFVPPAEDSAFPVAELVGALTAQLSELGVQVDVSESAPLAPQPSGESSPDGRRILAFVWLVEGEETLTVHFYESAGLSLRERRIPVSGQDAVSVEEVAIIVRSAVAALLERSTEPEVEAPRTESVAPPPPSEPSEASKEKRAPLGLTAGANLPRYAAEVPWQVGLGMYAEWVSASRHLRLLLGYTYFPAATAGSEQVSLKLIRHPVELAGAYEFPFGESRFFAGLEAGLVIDPVTRRTLEVAEGASPEADRTRVAWSAALRARLGVTLAPQVRLLLRGGPEVLLNPFDYTLGGSGGEILVEPYSVRPAIFFGISADLP